MKRVLTLILSVLMLASASAQEPPQQRQGTGTELTEYVMMGNTQREYVSYVPQNLGSKRPLLVACHGMNQNTVWMKGYMDLQPIADTAKFVTVYPQGIDNSWDISGMRDINYILKLIDVMVEKYDVDPGRVYMTGFSMGGMLTYHAMNKIADRIAAFAPISGYTMSGVTANANVRPIPIIHTHGTADPVVGFGNVQSNLNVWIQHNHCNATPTVTQNYRNTPHITRRVWSGGDDGVEVVLMEMADKGHWVSNDWGVWTADEIWKFCKRYHIDVQWPIVKPEYRPDQKFTSLEAAKGKTFAIVNETEGKAFFGSGAQNLGYEDYPSAFTDDNGGYQFKLEDSSVSGGYLLRLMTPEGSNYHPWGAEDGYLNAQDLATGWCCFILGLKNQNGQDILNGAVWNIEYVDGRGFALKNVGTGKYLHDATNAKYDDPKYFLFCTLKQVTTDVSEKLRVKSEELASASWFTLDGRKLNGQPTEHGIYIVNGKKVVIK